MLFMHVLNKSVCNYEPDLQVLNDFFLCEIECCFEYNMQNVCSKDMNNFYLYVIRLEYKLSDL